MLDRAREHRSQFVFTKGRGRDTVFWQSPRTRKQARPNVSTPTKRAAGIADLEIIVDTRERYAYRFASQQVTTTKRSLPSGDYGVVIEGQLVAAVERKSTDDLASSLTNGKLRFALAELAVLPRAAVVVENRYADVFKLAYVRPSAVAEGLAELQVRWPNVPIVFCDTRQLAEEWTYRFLAAACAWAGTELDLAAQPGAAHEPETAAAPDAPEPSTAEIRSWARSAELEVPDRGRLRPEVWQAWRNAHEIRSMPGDAP